MFKDHPKGLKTLFFTEMWERFGFYTMVAVLTLYMTNTFGWSEEYAAMISGFFMGVVYFCPILGGWLADRYLGQVKTVRIGAVVMGVGYALLAFSSLDRLVLFFGALAIITVGSGLLKANISVLVGNLYEKGSKLKDSAFNLFYMGINIGAFFAPIAATILHKISVQDSVKDESGRILSEVTSFNSYNVSFVVAAMGMIACIIIFQVGKKNYEMADVIKGKRKDTSSDELQVEEMSKTEIRQRYIALSVLLLIGVFFWTVFNQSYTSLVYFANNCTRQYDWLWAETYSSMNPLFIVAVTPLLLLFFRKLASKDKEPATPVKILWGCIVAGFWPLIMVAASYMGGDKDQQIMSPLWLISAYFVITIAEIFISPMGLSFVSKVAPPRVRGLSMGLWFGATGLGGIFSGLICAWLYNRVQHHTFFMILSGLLFFCAVLVFFFRKPLKRFS